jgi:hypothetical protein
MSTNRQTSRFLTNPNALWVTAGMEYIPACVSTWLIPEECRTASAWIRVRLKNVNISLTKLVYFKVTMARTMLLASWVLGSF